MKALKWWQKAVFYQIYPHSFADGNGDGISDFPGMTAKLDYLQDLGIDGIWLSPHYPSPFIDCGYDISDYTNVGPEYGSLADFKTFLSEWNTSAPILRPSLNEGAPTGLIMNSCIAIGASECEPPLIIFIMGTGMTTAFVPPI